MNRPAARSLVEEMGLRREDTRRLGRLDLAVFIALLASAAAWAWL